uniref:Putative secreted protein n=1 Tax=Anopheles darlingi TaxID=43151 RepID=A0A2M4DHN8_ANODA
MVQLISTATGRVPHKAALTLTLLSLHCSAYARWPSPHVTEHYVDTRTSMTMTTKTATRTAVTVGSIGAW